MAIPSSVQPRATILRAKKMKRTLRHHWTPRRIAVSELSLWNENARIPDYLLQSREPELIRILFAKYDLERLAGEIVKDSDLPQLEKLVVWDRRGKLVVLEGNRRLAVYKCLATPALIPDEPLRRKFEELRKKFPVDGKFKVEALVTTSKKEGMRFLNRKHYYGNNEKRWDQYERDHYFKRSLEKKIRETLTAREKRSIFRVNLGEKVKVVSLPDEMKQRILGSGFATTFYRVVDSNPGSKRLKYEKSDYDLRIEDEAEFQALLKVIIFNLLRKETLHGDKLNSRMLNQESDIEQYLNSISANDERAVDEIIDREQSAQPPKGRKGAGKKTSRRRKRTPKPYFSLIDPSLDLPTKTPAKTVSVYKELQTINVSQCPTGVNILVRILIDISVNHYLKKRKQDAYLNNELWKKISYIKNNYITEQDLQRVVELLNKDLLTRKLNQVAHNTIFEADATTIRDLWKNLQYFFAFLVK